MFTIKAEEGEKKEEEENDHLQRINLLHLIILWFDQNNRIELVDHLISIQFITG